MSHSTYVATVGDISKNLAAQISRGIEAARNAVKRSVTVRHNQTHSATNDYGSSGVEKIEGPKVQAFTGTGKASEIIDFSYILEQAVHYEDEQQIKLKKLLGRIDERAVYTASARQALNRLVKTINELINDPAMDEEDVINQIEGRIEMYLEDEGLSQDDTLEDLYAENLALHTMIGEEVSIEDVMELPIEAIEAENAKLRAQAKSLGEKLYVAETMQDVMESMGYRVVEFSVLDDAMEGEVYSSPDAPEVKVFMAYQSGGFMFEPVLDADPAEITEEMLTKPCSLHRQIIREAESRGLKLALANEEAPSVYDIATTADLSRREYVHYGSRGTGDERAAEARKMRARRENLKARTVD
ncbi:MAG: hypothetical protein IKO61_02665 [Lachnospiraceae bacterium]|nr:hypothetical protein [Lachnospiraceae bacterium]